MPLRPYPMMAAYTGGLVDVTTIDGERYLAKALDAAREVAPDVEIVREQREGHPVMLLGRASATARMVVVGTIGRSGLTGMLIGSTALDLPARSHCPVVVVRTRDGGSDAMDGPVLVGVVDSPLDEPAVAFAFDQASARGVELLAVHAWSDAPMPDIGRLGGQPKDWIAFFERERRWLLEGLAGYSDRYPDVTVHAEVVFDKPSAALVERSARAQLLVVGTRGRGPLTGTLLGSTSRAALKLSQCPVAVLGQGV